MRWKTLLVFVCLAAFGEGCADYSSLGSDLPCKFDHQCPADETCQEGRCSTNCECAHDSDCPAEQVCIECACEPICACISDDDCPISHICQNCLCIQKCDCESDADCPAGEICADCECLPMCDCYTDADCPEGFYCSEVCTCEPECECQSDQDCLAGDFCVDCTCSGCRDYDQDGFTSGFGFADCDVDCDDNNASIHPAATEVCDDQDNNCDRRVDEGFDLMNDSENCGECGYSCLAGQSCLEGYCVSDCECQSDYDCDDGDINTVNCCSECVCWTEPCMEGWLNLDGLADNRCESPVCECISDDDCPADSLCFDCQCIPYQPCTTSQDCNWNWLCVESGVVCEPGNPCDGVCLPN
jgi:hypothetical protein